MNKICVSIFIILTYCFPLYGKKIKLQPLIVIQINRLLDLSVDKFYTESLDAKLRFNNSGSGSKNSSGKNKLKDNLKSNSQNKSNFKSNRDSNRDSKSNSVAEMQKITFLLLKSAKSLPSETEVHFKKIFQALNVQLSLLLKNSKPIYRKQVWKSLFIISRSFNVKTYFYGFCAKDKSMWLQNKKSKPVNPIGVSSCVNAI